MIKGKNYEGTVVDIKFPNKGTVDCGEEGIATVKNTIPGQKVSFVVSKKRAGKPEGRLLEVLEKSELEDANPICDFYGICGGCSYQTMSKDNQLKLKSGMVKSILDNAVDYEYEFENIIESPSYDSYRNKMEFTFGDEYKDGPLSLGMHKKGGFYDIVTVDGCRICHEDYSKVIRCVLSFCKDKEIPYYHKMRHTGYLRHMVVRRSEKTKQLLIAIVTASGNPEFDAYIEELKDLLLTLELEADIKGILHVYNDGLADMVRSDRTEILYGVDYITEEVLGLEFKISLFSFFQTNSLGAENLYSKAREYVGETNDKVIFDLYSGTGTIAQLLAPVAKKVVGVEIVEEATKAAVVNAKKNGLDNCEFIAGDVLKVIDEIEDKPDMIVLDPPRDGINPKALKKIIDFGVDRIVYISCKPTSLGRDLEELQNGGYKLVKACCVDMFPHTANVETVALLSKLSEAKHHIEVKVNK